MLGLGITDQILRKSRFQVVERELLDKLLAELKLSTTNLVDRHTAISLGKMLAARLILSGQIAHSGPQTQISLRVIETETGRIAAIINETVGSSVPASIISEKLSKDLLDKLNTLYPLRGKVLAVNGVEITLNIGQREGVRMGQLFGVADEDLMLEIVSAKIETCIAKPLKGGKNFKPGQRVEVSK